MSPYVFLTLALLVPSGVMAWCPEIARDKDEFEGTTTLSTGWTECTDEVKIDVVCMEDEQGATYWILLGYYGKDWAFIRDDDALKLLIDGKLRTFSGTHTKDILEQGYVTELAHYKTSQGVFKAIAKADTVKF